MSGGCDKFPVATCFQAQHAKSAFRAVEGYPFHKARKDLGFGRGTCHSTALMVELPLRAKLAMALSNSYLVMNSLT